MISQEYLLQLYHKRTYIQLSSAHPWERLLKMFDLRIHTRYPEYIESMTIELPKQGFVFWNVGTGDSTTIAITNGVVMQVDLRHMVKAEDDDDPCCAIVDVLVEKLPTMNGKPYLSVFALTHPDLDHVQGFKDLLSRVVIGELWFTPRVFREYDKDLCEDAQAFKREAKRRVKKVIEKNGSVNAGDRVRVIGYDALLEEEQYKGLPSSCFSVPGRSVTRVDGVDRSDVFRAFIHSPFEEHAEGERNYTSLGMQITLKNGEGTGKAMLLGDLCYPTVKRIFKISKVEDTEWNVFLAPHHCSKSVMYWRDSQEDEEMRRQDVLDLIEASAAGTGYIVSSSAPVPATDSAGADPPHALAKERYEEIAPSGFLCTGEHPTEDTCEPIVFTLEEDGLSYTEPSVESAADKARSLHISVGAARGSYSAPAHRVGHGNFEEDPETPKKMGELLAVTDATTDER